MVDYSKEALQRMANHLGITSNDVHPYNTDTWPDKLLAIHKAYANVIDSWPGESNSYDKRWEDFFPEAIEQRRSPSTKVTQSTDSFGLPNFKYTAPNGSTSEQRAVSNPEGKLAGHVTIWRAPAGQIVGLMGPYKAEDSRPEISMKEMAESGANHLDSHIADNPSIHDPNRTSTTSISESRVSNEKLYKHLSNRNEEDVTENEDGIESDSLGLDEDGNEWDDEDDNEWDQDSEKPNVSRETSGTPQSVNTAHNVSQQMAGSVSVTPTDAAPAAAPAASGADTTDMSEYWKAIAKDHTTSIRGKGAEAKAARKRLAPYPLFKHFDDLVAAKKALEIPTDKLGPKGQGTVGESVPAGAQFATISPGDSDEYAARATRHNELVKAIADVSIHFGDLYGKQAPMPTTLHPDHDHSALLEPVKDSSGIVHLKSDISGPLDYGVVNEYRFGKGTFGYEMKPMDSPISPMTMADKTSSGLGASQKRTPAKKVSTGVSKFATPDNNPSPSYKVKTNFQSFEPTDYRNNKKTQAFVLANKKAFLISKMNEVHPLPTEEERARMSSAQHQSVVDQVFKNRTAWLNKSMKGNIDDMIPKDNS